MGRALKRGECGVHRLAIVLVLICAASLAGADTLRLKDGSVYQGKLISRDAEKIVFRVEQKGGIGFTREFKTGDVEALEEGPAPAEAARPTSQPAQPVRRTGRGTPYYVLPVHGAVGLEVSSAVVAECFRTAQEMGAQVVVLEIDSPGGSVGELNRLLDVLDRARGLRTVAYVKEAKSAAAILALACREIIMAERASIGAATPYVITKEGTPQTLAEKFESSVRADFRAAAERGGHNPLLAEGMMREDIVLGLQGRGPNVQVVEGSGDRPLKPQGRILTLTTKEAVDCGLALGSAEQVGTCGKLLNIPEWYDLTDHGRERTAEWAKQVHGAIEDFKSSFQNYEAACAQANAFAEARRRRDALDALRRAESNLRRMEELARKYPIFGDDDLFKKVRQEIKAVRMAVER